MTNKQRRILEDAEISSELMHEVDHYLKDVGAVLSGTIHEKEKANSVRRKSMRMFF